MSRHIENIFFQLLQCGVGKRAALDAPLTDELWERVFFLAKKHALVGVIFDVVENLPEEQSLPRNVLMKFAGNAWVIENWNLRSNAHMPELKSIFSDAGMAVSVLKGQGLSILYPNSCRRQCGDIDLWVDGKRDDILAFLKRGGWKLDRLYMHHIGADFFDDKIKVEVHFHPSWFNNPFTDRKLKKFFAEEAETQFRNENKELGIAVATSSFNCVYILLHIFRHLFDEGVGFRQLLDYYYVLIRSSEEDRKKAFETIKRFSLVKFSSALMWVMQNVFLLDDEYLICPPDEKRGRLMLEEILVSGNFGKYDKRNNDKGRSFFHHFVRRVKRLAKFVPLNASEVFWAPMFRVYQYFWRIAKGYRY
ncbi:MAG: nucleotidyltransferase family protein [Bacteroidales bacterium]|nr:nucleotidyltransferase family protein [Bacteroidales bacterium]